MSEDAEETRWFIDADDDRRSSSAIIMVGHPMMPLIHPFEVRGSRLALVGYHSNSGFLAPFQYFESCLVCPLSVLVRF